MKACKTQKDTQGHTAFIIRSPLRERSIFIDLSRFIVPKHLAEQDSVVEVAVISI